MRLPETVRARITEDRGRGRTYAGIADQITQEQVPTAQGGAQWHASTVRAVLQSVELDAAEDVLAAGRFSPLAELPGGELDRASRNE